MSQAFLLQIICGMQFLPYAFILRCGSTFAAYILGIRLQPGRSRDSATLHLALLNLKQDGLALILKSRASSLQHAEMGLTKSAVSQSAVG